MKFNKRNWSVAEAIKQRAELESLAEWAKSSERVSTPRVSDPSPSQSTLNKSVGLLNFYKNIIKFTLDGMRELKP